MEEEKKKPLTPAGRMKKYRANLRKVQRVSREPKSMYGREAHKSEN